MSVDHSPVIAQHAQRGLWWQIIGFGIWLLLAFVSVIGALENPMMAPLVAVSGLGVIIIGRGLRANGALLRIVQPPEPAWIAWVVPGTFVVGPMVIALGAWLLLRFIWAAP